MSEPKYLIVFPDCLVAPGCKTVGTWTLSRVTGNLGTGTPLLRLPGLPGTRRLVGDNCCAIKAAIFGNNIRADVVIG